MSNKNFPIINGFISAESIKIESETISEDKLNIFKEIFNNYIRKYIETGIPDNGVCLNDVVDGVPRLNQNEFQVLQKNAFYAGWDLTQHEDNFDSITYRLKKR